jgi:hypothetical protein
LFQKLDRGRLERQLAKRLQRLGYEVTKPIAPVPTG